MAEEQPITDKEFDAALLNIVDEEGVLGLLSIPGVFAAVARQLRSKIIERARENREGAQIIAATDERPLGENIREGEDW